MRLESCVSRANESRFSARYASSFLRSLSGTDFSNIESASRPAGGGRGRGRRGGFRAAAAAEETDAAAEEAADSPRRKGLVVDPKTDTPFTVTLSVTTHDFGMGEELAADRAAKTPVQDDAAAADAPALAADAPGDAVTPAATAEPAQNEED